MIWHLQWPCMRSEWLWPNFLITVLLSLHSVSNGDNNFLLPDTIAMSIKWISSVQFSLSVMSDSLWPHESQHARPPCPSPTPRVHPNPRQVGDAIQPSHPLSSPFPPAAIPPSIRDFSNESALHIRWPKYWSFSFNISPSYKYSGLISGGSPCNPRDSQESSPTPQFKSMNSCAFSFLSSSTLTSIHDYWKNHSFD